MEQRYSMVTLGVRDVAAAKIFYQALGWRAVKFDSKDVCFFRMGPVLLGLYGRAALAADAGLDAGLDKGLADSAPQKFNGVAIAWNGRSEADVDAALKTAIAAGATLVKPAQKVFWGGYSGYFADPDGHLWEVAYNPFWTIDETGAVIVADAPDSPDAQEDADTGEAPA